MQGKLGKWGNRDEALNMQCNLNHNRMGTKQFFSPLIIIQSDLSSQKRAVPEMHLMMRLLVLRLLAPLLVSCKVTAGLPSWANVAVGRNKPFSIITTYWLCGLTRQIPSLWGERDQGGCWNINMRHCDFQPTSKGY